MQDDVLNDKSRIIWIVRIHDCIVSFTWRCGVSTNANCFICGSRMPQSAVELVQNEFDNKVLVVAQKTYLSEDIDASNLFEYGTVCRIVNTMPHENDENCIKVLIEGLVPCQISRHSRHRWGRSGIICRFWKRLSPWIWPLKRKNRTKKR